MSNGHMTLRLKIWRQKDRDSKGRMVDYTVENVDPDMSFLEMLDVLNEDLAKKGEEQIDKLPFRLDTQLKASVACAAS